jgi:hypothetical protein
MRVMPAGAWVLPFALVVGVGASASISKLDADRLQSKLNLISENGRSSRPTALRTPVTESEVNSYLNYMLGPDLPAGVSDPSVSIQGDGRLAGRAVVDLSQLRADRASGGWLDPLGYLGGKAAVLAVGSLHTGQGMARFDLESATVSGVPVPISLLQALVTQYSHTPDNPDGLRLNESFKLPAGIKEIQVGKGEAVVVQ